MIQFHISHRDKNGIEHEYDGLFRCSIDAVNDCLATLGFGRIRVVAITKRK